MHRSIVLAQGWNYWVYAYLLAEKDRASIEDDELKAFRALAAVYGAKSKAAIAKELAAKELVEICHGPKAQVQERRLRGDP